jgi:hypothetical protein
MRFDTQYYWQIEPYNAEGSPENCPIWSFRTRAGVVPGAAVSPVPANEALNVSVNQVLSWTMGSGVPATGYKVYFGIESPPTEPAYDGTLTTYTPSLQYGQKYYWRVVPFNDEGNASNCPIWNFTTFPLQPLPAVLVDPKSGQSDVPLHQVLSWETGAGSPPTHFKIYFGGNDSFDDNSPTATIQASTVETQHTWTPPNGLEAGVRYYWRIVPTNPSGDALNCPTWSFNTKANPKKGMFGCSGP